MPLAVSWWGALGGRGLLSGSGPAQLLPIGIIWWSLWEQDSGCELGVWPSSSSRVLTFERSLLRILHKGVSSQHQAKFFLILTFLFCMTFIRQEGQNKALWRSSEIISKTAYKSLWLLRLLKTLPSITWQPQGPESQSLLFFKNELFSAWILPWLPCFCSVHALVHHHDITTTLPFKTTTCSKMLSKQSLMSVSLAEEGFARQTTNNDPNRWATQHC